MGAGAETEAGGGGQLGSNRLPVRSDLSGDNFTGKLVLDGSTLFLVELSSARGRGCLAGERCNREAARVRQADD